MAILDTSGQLRGETVSFETETVLERVEGRRPIVAPLQALIRTENSWTPLILRSALGLMILPHGLQKAFGLFGGYGFKGTLGYFTEQVKVPKALGVAAILAESLGGAALLAGAGTRLAAAAVGTNMVVAAAKVHRQNGFFMNWYGNQKGEGIEFFILAAGLALGLIVSGGGKLSVDRALSR